MSAVAPSWIKTFHAARYHHFTSPKCRRKRRAYRSAHPNRHGGKVWSEEIQAAMRAREAPLALSTREIEREGVAAMIVARKNHRLTSVREADLGYQKPGARMLRADNSGDRLGQIHSRDRGAGHTGSLALALKQVIEGALECVPIELVGQAVAAHDLDAVDQRVVALEPQAFQGDDRRAGPAAQRARDLLVRRMFPQRDEARLGPIAQLAEHTGDALVGGDRSLDPERGGSREEAAAAVRSENQAVLLQQLQGLTQGRARDVEQFGEFGFGGKLIPGLQLIPSDQLHDRFARAAANRLYATKLQGRRSAHVATHKTSNDDCSSVPYPSQAACSLTADAVGAQSRGRRRIDITEARRQSRQTSDDRQDDRFSDERPRPC